MNVSMIKVQCLFFLVLCAAGLLTRSWAVTTNIASCSQVDVASAISTAAVNDTIQVPAGTCTWSGLAINKPISLKGAGTGLTKISIINNTVNKQTDGIIRISDFGFSKKGGGNESKGFLIDGPWKNAEPVIFQDNLFTISGSGLFRISVPGGVIIANNQFTGEWDDSFLQPKNDQDSYNSWTTADSMGSKDSTGKLNIYVENNTFYGGTNQGIDCDGASRCVYRYNTLTYSSFNSHGKDTGPFSLRHFEVYNNTWIHNGGSTQIAAQNWAIWIRGGTGVIFNNQIADIAGGYWGNKPEVHLAIRGAEDVRPQGSCSNVKYPVPQQLGQNHDGTQYFTDPIYIWGNTGTVEIADGWDWGNPCGLTWSNYFQWGRDGVKDGTHKPGYTPFKYPHPLVNVGGSSNQIIPPMDLHAL